MTIDKAEKFDLLMAEVVKAWRVDPCLTTEQDKRKEVADWVLGVIYGPDWYRLKYAQTLEKLQEDGYIPKEGE